MRDQVLWRKTGRIEAMLAERLDIDAVRALDTGAIFVIAIFNHY